MEIPYLEKSIQIIDQVDPQDLFNNDNERHISIELSIRIIELLFPDESNRSFDDYISLLDNLEIRAQFNNDIWNFMSKIFVQNSDLVDLYLQNPKLVDVFNNIYDYDIQTHLTSDRRKQLATNYTTETSADLLISMLPETNKVRSMTDPFVGSGRLICAYLQKFQRYPYVHINDIMPVACILAYARILHIYVENNVDPFRIKVTIGDAFQNFSSVKSIPKDQFYPYDLVLMNPPFTRSHRIDYVQRKKLHPISMQYRPYLKGQNGLHIFSIFLADSILKPNGIIAAVLPATIIFANYANGVQKYLMNNHKIQSIIQSNFISFSDGSDYNELILLSRKTPSHYSYEINIYNIDEDRGKKQWDIRSIKIIKSNEFSKNSNWLKYYYPSTLLDFEQKLIQSKLIKSGDELGLKIVRGLEMYGPNFYFFPNKKWDIENKGNKFLISSGNMKLEIPSDYIKKCLRKPGIYKSTISPPIDEYVLSIPPDADFRYNDHWLYQYIKLTEDEAKPAKKRFSTMWLSHINHQIKTKQPFGHLFFIDKFSLTNTSILCHYTDTKMTCTKNFYVLKNLSKLDTKVLAAWMNSNLYLALFIINRREIGGSYGRLQISDLNSTKLFIDFNKFNEISKMGIAKKFDQLRIGTLPNLSYQFNLKLKREIDILFLNELDGGLETDRLLDQLYSSISAILLKFKS